MSDMGNYFEVRQGTDKEWGIYLRAYNIRIATFSRGATEERKMIKNLIEGTEQAEPQEKPDE